MFNEGSDLKTGLINVAKGYEFIIKNKNEKKIKTTDSIDLIPSSQVAKRMTQGQKWSRILEYMRRNPQALMQVIPSPRPGENPKEVNLPNFGAMNDNITNTSKPSVPAIAGHPAQSIHKIQSEKEHSMGESSYYSKQTAKSRKRRSNKNSMRMVVIKPVPVPKSEYRSSKKFKLKGNYLNYV
jgi:hypothetical protein